MHYQIEFGHIYSNEQWGDKQELSYNILKQFIANINDTHSLCVLIDDYNSDGKTPTIPIPDVEIYFEKDMALQGDDYLRDIENTYWRNIKDKEVLFVDDIALQEKINGQKRYTCCFLTAIWMLNKYWAVLQNGDARNTIFLTILEKKYEKNEMKALKLIKTMGILNVEDKFKYIFY